MECPECGHEKSAHRIDCSEHDPATCTRCRVPVGIQKAQADERARTNIAGRVSAVRRRLREEADRAARLSTEANDAWAQCADELRALHDHLADVLPNLRRALDGEEIA